MKIQLGFLGATLSIARAAFLQSDEAIYLDAFDKINESSYAQVDDFSLGNLSKAPQELLGSCKKGNLPIKEKVLSSDTGVVLSSAAASECDADTICVVPSGLTMMMDSSLNVGALIVRGALEWNDESQQASTQFLCGGFIVVEGNGKFSMNLNVYDKVAWIYIKNNGATHKGLRSRAFGADASDPTDFPVVDVMGREMTRTWSLLSEPLEVGEETMKLLHHPKLMGWQVGDRLGVAPTERLATGWGEEFWIEDISDDGTIFLNKKAQSVHKADFDSQSAPDKPALKSAEVLNLSRNIIITGDDFEHVDCDPTLPEAVLGEQTSVQGCRCSSFRKKCTVGLHTMHKHRGLTRIQNTRVEKCGQRGIEGKYCLHFHHMEDCPDCLFKDNAIESSQQRGIIVHGTHNSRLEGNVLYNVRGAGIYIEDGNEMWNTLEYNVVICPFPFSDQTYHGCTVPGTSNRVSDTKDNHSAFFTQAGSNNMIGNRGANAFNGMFLKEGGRGRGKAYDKVCESAARIGRMEGNTFHDNGRFGTYTLGFNYPKVTDQSISNNGYNADKTLCEAFNDGGDTRGLPGSFHNHIDYGNGFVGHYSAGDIQHNGHYSTDNNNLLYWKETKNFENGCASHIINSHYSKGTMALPDQATFIIENTSFGEEVLLEANHHCNVGATGVLCMPQYVLHNVRWKSRNTGRPWIQFQFINDQNHDANQMFGGIFTLSPEDASIVNGGGVLDDSLFPPGYVSLVSNRFGYLLATPSNACIASDTQYGNLYDNGILCTTPLRSLKVYTRGLFSDNGPPLQVDVWFKSGGLAGQRGSPDATQFIGFHQIGANGVSEKQGYSIPVIPGTDHSYKISLSGSPLPNDWVVEFSDPVIGNRWNPDFIYLNVEGRNCAEGGLISSQHDRKFLWSGDEWMADEAWGKHGACVGSGSQPSDTAPIDCASMREKAKMGEIGPTECQEKCAGGCNENSYCACGTETCQCKPGYSGSQCEVNLCAAARCGEHGTCSAIYLGSTIPVTSENACICEDGWAGPLCDKNPCLEQGITCSGNGKCVAINESDAMCECDSGFSGAECETTCTGICQGSFPFGCANDLPDKAALGCRSTGECHYLKEGEDYPYEGFCTYKEYQRESVCSCPNTSNDCQVAQPCDSNGNCQSPVDRIDGTPCNSVPWGVCKSGQCVAPNTSPTSSPVDATNPPGSSQPETDFRCGCERCTFDVLETMASGYTCRDRIDFLQSTDSSLVGGPFDELSSCRIVSEEFPGLCTCHPEECEKIEGDPMFTPEAPSTSPSLQPTESRPPPVEFSFYCGCSECTQSIWENSMADGYSCGERVTFLQSGQASVVGGPFSEFDACRQVSDEFPEICGICDPDTCSSLAPTVPSGFCGCESCTQSIWEDTRANGYSCGERILFLQSDQSVTAGGPFTEYDSCSRVSYEFPDICGPCDPDTCDTTGGANNEENSTEESNEPDQESSCDNICQGNFPFSCADSIPGVVKYGCYSSGGCYYATSFDDPYPYDIDNWCTYKVERGSLRRRRN